MYRPEIYEIDAPFLLRRGRGPAGKVNQSQGRTCLSRKNERKDLSLTRGRHTSITRTVRGMTSRLDMKAPEERPEAWKTRNPKISLNVWARKRRKSAAHPS